MAEGYIPGVGGVSYKPGTFGETPKGILGGKLGSAMARSSSARARQKAIAKSKLRIAREAEARRIAEELARKKAEQQRLQQRLLLEQQQKATQQKITAGTIGGQVTRQKKIIVKPFSKVSVTPTIKPKVIEQVKDIRIPQIVGLFGTAKIEPIKEKVKRFGVGLFTPSIAPSEIKDLPEEQRGLEASKAIFLGGLEGLYQYAKRSTKEIDVIIPVRTGILTPIVGKKKPITLGKVKPARVVAEVIPRTTAGVLAIRYFPKLPKLIQVPATGAVSVLGVKGALDVSRTKEERIASGIIGTGAAVGTFAQVVPYARGLKAQTIGRLTGKYKPIKVQPEGFKAIQLKETKIGLIPEKAPLKTGVTTGVKLPTVSPLKRGGFGVKPSEKLLFLGKGQTVATSQRGLFKEGVTIKPTPTAPKEFFVSPQDPFAKIPVTRVSRLGLEKPVAIPKQVKLGFGLPKKPQVGVEFGVKIARVEKGGAFRIGTGTELEAIKTMPTIKVVKKLGVTTIKGQAIDIFQIKTTPTKGVSKLVPKVPTTEGITRIPGESVISTSLATQRVTTIIPSTTKVTPILKAPTIPTKPLKPIPSLIVPSRRTPILSVPTTPISPTILQPSKALTQISISLQPYRKAIPKAPPFVLPRPKIRFREKSKRARQLFPQPTQYQASFTASALNLRGTVPKEYEKLAFGGLRLRPIVDTPIQRRIKRTRII